MRALARTLHGRVFLSRSSVMIVRGEPNPLKLKELLCQKAESLQLDNLSLIDLGFSSSDVVVLGRGSLTVKARAVQHWRYSIEKRMAGQRGAR